MACSFKHLIFYAAALLALHACGRSNGHSPTYTTSGEAASSSCGALCRIFVTDGAITGAMGITGADEFCNADPARPPGDRSYKALIGATGRRAPTTSDWPLRASTTYQRPDGTTIGTTTAAGLFAFNLGNSIHTTGARIWTGLSNAWAVTGNCGEWTLSGAGDSGAYGTGNATDGSSVGAGTDACNAAHSLYCVEQ